MAKLTRREALGVAAAAALTPMASASDLALKIIRPPRLNQGDVVGVVSPAGFTSDPLDLDIVRSNLAKLGLQAKIGPFALERYGYLGGTDRQRADDLNHMIHDSEVKAIVCLRGGYGTTRMLHLVDYAGFHANSKILWGFSDITGLLNALNRKSGVVTFHAATGSSDWGSYDLESMRRVMMLGESGDFPSYQGSPNPVAETLVPGKAKGRLVGGNLSLLCAVGGSPFAPDYREAIVFIEEIGEEPYRVDRMLTQLWQDNSLKQASGIVFGGLRLRASQSPSEDPKDWTMLDVLRERAKTFGLPCFTGFPTGHISDQVTMPIGCRVEMDADHRTLKLLEPAVS